MEDTEKLRVAVVLDDKTKVYIGELFNINKSGLRDYCIEHDCILSEQSDVIKIYRNKEMQDIDAELFKINTENNKAVFISIPEESKVEVDGIIYSATELKNNFETEYSVHCDELDKTLSETEACKICDRAKNGRCNSECFYFIGRYNKVKLKIDKFIEASIMLCDNEETEFDFIELE